MLAKRGKKSYCYKSYREKNRVCKEYLGNISSQASQNFIKEQEHKKKVKNKRKTLQNEINKLINTVDELHSITDIMIRYFLIECDYYIRKSEIRRIKNED